MSQTITEALFEMQDLKYRDFTQKLIPDIEKEKIIGVRVPDLRAYAKKYYMSDAARDFLSQLPHRYYDENNLHGFLIGQILDFDKCVSELERFLPYVDNWATCDLLNPKCLGNNPEKLYSLINLWINSKHVYTVRFAVDMLMTHFLGEYFRPEVTKLAASIDSENYYIRMAVAWFFATALAKQYENAVGYLEDNRLDIWTHNKTISKACESLRVPEESKAYLKSLRRKKN